MFLKFSPFLPPLKADLKKAQEIAPGDKGKLAGFVVKLHLSFRGDPHEVMNT